MRMLCLLYDDTIHQHTLEWMHTIIVPMLATFSEPDCTCHGGECNTHDLP